MALARMLPADVLEGRMLKLLDDPPPGIEHVVVLVLNEAGEPWSAKISRSVLDLLRRWLDRTRRKDRAAGDWMQVIGVLAERTAPRTIDQALELLTGIERAKAVPIWNRELRQAIDLLELRRRFWDAMTMAVMQGG